MISVALNWIYLFVTIFLTGFGLCAVFDRLFACHIQKICSIAAVGLMAVTVYAQVFSLFYKVGFAANLLLTVGCFGIAVVRRKQIAEVLLAAWKSKSAAWKLVMAASIVVWCYCTSRGYMHYDSDLYHAQSIRWIEEYGIVKGLGNIHVRFAYNSSFFALSALYSMKFLCGKSLHTINGFLALMLWMQVMDLFRFRRNRNTLVTDFARAGAFYYLTVIYSDIVAPASDYAIMCVVFFIIIKWLELLENDENKAAPYALLCVGGVCAVTLKLTAGLILVLVLKPVFLLVRDKKWRDIGLYFLLGLIVITPWIARTAVISGYFLYPFPAFDILDVDWKIDAAAAALDAAEIKTWGRGLNNAALVDMPVSEWFQNWFATLPATGKLFVLADFGCIILFVILIVNNLFVILKQRRSSAYQENQLESKQLFVLASVILSYGFWQLSAPLLRYGYAYVLLVITITAGILCDMLIKYFQKHQKKDMIKGIAVLGTAALLVFSAAKGFSLARYAAAQLPKEAYIWQQDYGIYALESFEEAGSTFYYPVSGDRTGYESFPALPRKTKVVLRGETLRDGFCPEHFSDTLP